MALGGTLYQKLPTYNQIENHRVNTTSVFEEKYIDSHKIILQERGILSQEYGKMGKAERVLDVNSLHRQAVKKLGVGLQVEAISEDGVIEAFSLNPKQGDVIAVQWHPEWFCGINRANDLVRNVFKQMCKKRQDERFSLGEE